jgi:hypothetical protein
LIGIERWQFVECPHRSIQGNRVKKFVTTG